MGLSSDDREVVEAIKTYARKVNRPIDYVSDVDVLSVVIELLEEAPLTFPSHECSR